MAENGEARPVEGAGHELSTYQGSSSLELYPELEGSPLHPRPELSPGPYDALRADVEGGQTADTITFEGGTLRVIWHFIDGYRFGTLAAEYSGTWYCHEKHCWNGATHGYRCPTCGEDGTPNRPPPPPLPAPAPPEEVIKKLRGLVQYLRESPRQQPGDRLRWVTRKVAWMLVVGELVDLQSAVHALRDDAEDAGVSRAEAQTIIQTTCDNTWRTGKP